MSNTVKTPSLPQVSWKRATCEVCGDSFDYMTKRRPHTCKKGECLYKFEFKIDSQNWANHQPGLFEAAGKK